jgi:hypothetical protein
VLLQGLNKMCSSFLLCPPCLPLTAGFCGFGTRVCAGLDVRWLLFLLYSGIWISSGWAVGSPSLCHPAIGAFAHSIPSQHPVTVYVQQKGF